MYISLSPSLALSLSIYIYIHRERDTHIHVYTCISAESRAGVHDVLRLDVPVDQVVLVQIGDLRLIDNSHNNICNHNVNDHNHNHTMMIMRSLLII